MFNSMSSPLIKLSFSLDLDPCDKLQCSFYAKCKAYGPYNATCVCDEDSDIPNYDDQVCSQEKVTYQNFAFLEQESCLKSRKIKVKRPGSCERKLFLLSNDLGMVDSNFFCYAATVLSPHRNVLIFTQRMHKPT